MELCYIRSSTASIHTPLPELVCNVLKKGGTPVQHTGVGTNPTIFPHEWTT